MDGRPVKALMDTGDAMLQERKSGGEAEFVEIFKKLKAKFILICFFVLLLVAICFYFLFTTSNGRKDGLFTVYGHVHCATPTTKGQKDAHIGYGSAPIYMLNVRLYKPGFLFDKLLAQDSTNKFGNFRISSPCHGECGADNYVFVEHICASLDPQFKDGHMLILTQDRHMLTLTQDRHMLILSQDRHMLILTQDRHVLILTQDRHVLILTQDRHDQAWIEEDLRCHQRVFIPHRGESCRMVSSWNKNIQMVAYDYNWSDHSSRATRWLCDVVAAGCAGSTFDECPISNLAGSTPDHSTGLFDQRLTIKEVSNGSSVAWKQGQFRIKLPAGANRETIADILIDEHVSILSQDEHVSILSQDEHVSILSQDEHVSILTQDEQVSILSQDRHMLILSQDEHVSILSQDEHVSILSQDEHVSILSHDEHVSILSQDEHVSILSQDEHVSILSQDEHVSILSHDEHVSILTQDL
uniref:Uncharacterized protein n=1 Tax=Ditylenchus dipsaci TaxID=166011 RepID=A0A915CLW6_9BILA